MKSGCDATLIILNVIQVVTTTPDPTNNGTTETAKITRAEFLKILDRNLKGLSRLRNLEWREAKKVTVFIN